jgi:hypothetical protein
VVFTRADLSTGDWVPISQWLRADSLSMEWTMDVNPDVPSGFFMVQLVPLDQPD